MRFDAHSLLFALCCRSGEKLLARVREGALIGVHELVKSDSKLLSYRDKSDLTALLHAAKVGNGVMIKVCCLAPSPTRSLFSLSLSRLCSDVCSLRRWLNMAPIATRPVALCKSRRFSGHRCWAMLMCVLPRNIFFVFNFAPTTICVARRLQRCCSRSAAMFNYEIVSAALRCTMLVSLSRLTSSNCCCRTGRKRTPSM